MNSAGRCADGDQADGDHPTTGRAMTTGQAQDRVTRLEARHQKAVRAAQQRATDRTEQDEQDAWDRLADLKDSLHMCFGHGCRAIVYEHAYCPAHRDRGT